MTICGFDLAHQRSRAAECVGFAAGYLPLTERMRVREYLRLYGQLYGIADPNPLIDEGLERFRIADLAGAMGTELSSGQRTLIGIVRATLHRPRLLVLDEPTASLDPDVAQRVRAGLLDLCDRDGTALLMTSHDMSDVVQVCERVVFLSHGRIVADGSPETVASDVRPRRPHGRVPPSRRDGTSRPAPNRATTREPDDRRRPADDARASRGCACARSRAGTRTCSCAARTACSTSRCGRSSTCCCSVRSPRSSAPRGRRPRRRRPATCSPASCSGTSSTSRRSR